MNTLVTTTIACPYCDYKNINTDFPHDTINVGSSIPTEPLLVLPYARDIGAFDPPTSTGHGEWTRVGTDFLGSLGYELFGILRWEPNQKVYYKVGRCNECQCLFDVFANYTEQKTLSEMWGHLVGQSTPGQTFVKVRVDLLWWKYISSTPLLIVSLAVIYLLSFVPQVLLLINTYYGSQKLTTFTQMYAGEIAERLIGVLIVFILLLISVRLAKVFEDQQLFEELFVIKNTNGVVYWTNFAISRFIGVQRTEKIIALNASMIFGGGVSTLVLLSCWLQLRFGWQSLLYWAIVLPVPFAISYTFYFAANRILNRFVQAAPFPQVWVYLLSLLKPEIPLQLKAFLTSLILWFSLPLVYFAFIIKGSTGFLYFTELVFWMFISFQIGTGVWNATAVSTYILNGVTRIPMKLDPRNSFEELRVLMEVGRLANLGLSTLIAAAILFSLSSIFVFTSNSMYWIINWIQVSLIYMYAIIIFRTKRISRVNNLIQILTLAVLFIFVKIAFGSPPQPGWLVTQIPFLQTTFLVNKQLYQYIELVLLGLLSTYIFYIQSTTVNNILQGLKEASKKKTLRSYQKVIHLLEEELISRINQKPEDTVNINERNTTIQAIRDASLVFQMIEKIPTDPLIFRRSIEIALPLVTTVLFPVFLDWLLWFFRNSRGTP